MSMNITGYERNLVCIDGMKNTNQNDIFLRLSTNIPCSMYFQTIILMHKYIMSQFFVFYSTMRPTER